jgi:molecular chaperone HtpG
MRFNSSANEDSNGLTSFAEYTERMAKGQKQVYYISGASRSAVQSDPLVEIFRRKGLEVFYLYDPIDEFVMTGFGKYQDFELVSVEQADLSKIEELPDSVEEQPLAEPLSESDEAVFIKLIEKIKEILDDRVTEVRTSRRLKESASCLVNPDNYMTSHMQKILHTMNKDHSVPKKIFEINKDHQLTRNLLRIYKADPADAFIHSVVEQLFESALLLEGYLNDPHLLVNRIQDVLLQSSNWHPANK